MLFGGILAWGITHYSINTVQFLTNVVTPIVAVITLILYLKVKSNLTEKFHKVFLDIFLVIWLFSSWHREYLQHRSHYLVLKNSYDRSFVKIAREYLEKVDNPIGVFFLSDQHYLQANASNIENIIESTYSLDYYLHTYKYNSNLHTVSLSSYKINPSKYGIRTRYVTNLKNNLTFERYLQNQTIKGSQIDIEKYQCNFCNDFNIKYILAGKDANIPTSLQKEFRQKLVDEKTGLQLFLRDRINSEKM